MPLNYLDILLAILLLLFAWRGFRKGLVIEIATLAALVLGILLAYYFSDMAAEQLKNFFSISNHYLKAISFILIFIVVLLVVILMGKLIEKLADIMMLGFLNKLAGAIFGILKGALFISIFIFIIGLVSFGNHIFSQETRDKSILYSPVASVATTIFSWIDPGKFDFEFPEKEKEKTQVY